LLPVGENSKRVRKLTCENMDYLGISIDLDKNTKVSGTETDISIDESKVRTLIIPTNEELVIARDTKRIIEAS